MDPIQYFDQLPLWVWSYFGWLTPDQLRLVGYVALAFWTFGWIWFVYYCIRRGLGHHRWHGRWYNREGFVILIQELYAGVREGRVPDHETMQLLDRYIYGKRGSFLRNLNRADSI